MKKLLIVVLVSAISLVACVSREQQQPVVTESRIAPKNPTAWTLVEWRTGAGQNAVIPARNERPIFLEFFADEKTTGLQGRVSGYSGCNNLFGSYKETETSLTFAHLGSTQKACPGLAMQTENAFLQRLSNQTLPKRVVKTDAGNTLILTTREGDTWTFVETDSIRGLPGTTRLIYVDSKKVRCTGTGTQMCYRIRESADEPWQIVYGQIEGFDFKPGIEYRLRIKEIPVVEANAPADTSNVHRVLDMIIEQKVVR